MDFKAECTAGDQIDCFGMPLTDTAQGNGCKQQFLHLLRKGSTDTEVWRARTTWAPVFSSNSSSSVTAAANASGVSPSAAPSTSNGAAGVAAGRQDTLASSNGSRLMVDNNSKVGSSGSNAGNGPAAAAAGSGAGSEDANGSQQASESGILGFVAALFGKGSNSSSN